jgi:hypothetical protein
MELFQNAYYVRLQSMVHSKYIHAAEDGRTVRLDALQTSHNAVWAVERRQFAGIEYVLCAALMVGTSGPPTSSPACFRALGSLPGSSTSMSQRRKR